MLALLVALTSGCVTPKPVARPTAIAPPVAIVPPTAECGEERWEIKLGYDPPAAAIDLSHPTIVDIDWLRAQQEPAHIPDHLPRQSPVEMTAYRLNDVTLVRYFAEGDRDYHLVIAGANGDTMIAEIPEPGCIHRECIWKRLVEGAREVMDASPYRPSRHSAIKKTVSLVGIGFFDRKHGQTGRAPNGIELHPVIGICFGDGCDPVGY